MNDEKISTDEAYLKKFSVNLRDKAFQVAIENRRFEIELYWKRATYFWTLIAAVFIGYFALQGNESKGSQFASFVISCIGLMFSLAWYLISRASAYWHANWDAHVHQLEDELVGPLQKAKIDNNAFNLRDITSPYHFSGTKIHAVTSLYIIFVWSFLLIESVSVYSGWTEPFTYFNMLSFGLITAVFVFILLKKSKPGKLDKVNAFVVEKKPLNDYTSKEI